MCGVLLTMMWMCHSVVIHHRLQILGDRGFKYKYTNPNVLLLAVASGNPTDPINQQQLTMMLIDTVTGGVLVQQRHEAAAGPVHGLVSEHWAAYSFTDLRTMRPQVRGSPALHRMGRDGIRPTRAVAAPMIGRGGMLACFVATKLRVMSFQHAHTGDLGTTSTLVVEQQHPRAQGA